MWCGPQVLEALIKIKCDLEPISDAPNGEKRQGPDSTSTTGGARYWSDWDDFIRLVNAILRDPEGFLHRNDVEERGTTDRALGDKRAMRFWTKIAQWWVSFFFGVIFF